MDGAGYMSFIIAKLSVHTTIRFGLVFQRSMTLSRCHRFLVCGKRCVPSATRPARRALVHKRSVHVPSRESAQPTKTTNHMTFSTMPAWRRARTTESENASETQVKTSPTGTHSAMSEVMTTHSKTEVDILKFFFFG